MSLCVPRTFHVPLLILLYMCPGYEALVWNSLLQVLSTTNKVHQRVGELQRTSYDPANPEHVAQLELLWESLRPESRRKDWGELGFQNSKLPQSDFRGMGMLGECRHENKSMLYRPIDALLMN